MPPFRDAFSYFPLPLFSSLSDSESRTRKSSWNFVRKNGMSKTISVLAVFIYSIVVFLLAPVLLLVPLPSSASPLTSPLYKYYLFSFKSIDAVVKDLWHFYNICFNFAPRSALALTFNIVDFSSLSPFSFSASLCESFMPSSSLAFSFFYSILNEVPLNSTLFLLSALEQLFTT